MREEEEKEKRRGREEGGGGKVEGREGESTHYCMSTIGERPRRKKYCLFQ